MALLLTAISCSSDRSGPDEPAITSAVQAAGSVYTWGGDTYGQLGNGTPNADVGTPASIGITNARSVACGQSYHSLVLANNGNVYGFGQNTYSQVGPFASTATPQQISLGPDPAIAVATGAFHSLALLSTGRVKAWGRNNFAQCGFSTPGDANVTTPTDVGLSNIVAIAAGAYHNLAINDQGHLFVWGRNISGELGLGHVNPVTSPQLVNLDNAVSISAGYLFSLVRRTQTDPSGQVVDSVWAFGANTWGNLGLTPDNAAHPTPMQVPGLTDVKEVTAGGFHATAVKEDGSLLTWGRNDFGQLGIGVLSGSGPARRLVMLPGVQHARAGHGHTLAITSNGDLWAWGDNRSLQVGDGTNVTRTSPFNIGALSHVVAMDACSTWSMAVVAPSCTTGTECASGFCADGVCCDTACTGQCEACAEPDHVGHCIPVSGAPRGNRPACEVAETDCGTCDGQDTATCTYPPTTGCGDRDGDGLTDGSEATDGDAWTDPDIFNGMRARAANNCHATPSCPAIDTLAEVTTCTAPVPLETKDQAGGWNWQNPSTADICDTAYGFHPNWSGPACGADWQVDFQGFIKLENGGQHCFRATGDTNGACGSIFFNTATTGITSASAAQCYNVPAGIYPVRWFYEMAGGPKTSFRVSYCYGGTQTCEPTESVPSRLLRTQYSPGNPVCDPQGPCTELCPCDIPGRPCSSDAQCGPGQVCGVNNGGHFGLPRDARACWPPECAVTPQGVGCGFPNAPCGSCEDVKPCTTNADCPTGQTCANNGHLFNSAHPKVCWPAGCDTNPVQTGCGSPSSPCGKCPCTPSCAGKRCGDNPSDGCGGVCTNFCQCTPDSVAPARRVLD